MVWELQSDLAAKVAFATAWSETSTIDFGTPEARQHLVSGWSPDQLTGGGIPFVHGVGGSSALRFHVTEVRKLPVIVRLRPTRGEAPVRTVSVELNGTPLTQLTLKERAARYRFMLPAERLATGGNNLLFRYRSADETGPAPRGTVAWFRMQIGTPGDEQAADLYADAENRLLFIPFGTRVEIPVVVEPGAELRLDRLDLRGGESAQLAIGLHTDEDDRELAVFGAGNPPQPVPLPVKEPDVGFLVLQAAADGSWESTDGVFLRGAEVWAPRLEEKAKPARGEHGKQPNVLIYLVDTLRADHLGVYGYNRDTSPRLDAFARTATIFERAIGQSSWTRPSTASVFTGQLPLTHGVTQKRHALSVDTTTLAESLYGAGYDTAAFVTNPNVASAFGFGQGFGIYRLLKKHSDSTLATEHVLAWLERREDERPFFLYVHTPDPHGPYLPPEPHRSRLAGDADRVYRAIQAKPKREKWESDEETIRQLLALYDAEIAANDENFGRLLDDLKRRDLFDDTLIVFLSDHGEEFFDHHDWNHGRGLHAETLDFPLLVKLPDQRRGRRVTEPAQHIDVMPTILDALGVPLPEGIEGRSLLPLLAGEAKHPLGPRAAYSHVDLNDRLSVGIAVGEWKLIDRRTARRPPHPALPLARRPSRTKRPGLPLPRAHRGSHSPAERANRTAGRREPKPGD